MDNPQMCLPQDLYFIGIGGAGMSALASIAHGMGYRVSGSDILQSENTERLQEQGIPVYIGHCRERIRSVEAVVVSSAIPGTNEEVQEAQALGLPIIHRGEMLAQLLNPKKGIAIAGTHGKTTTTSMISLLLEMADMDPTVLVGGEVEDIGGNAKNGTGEYFVSEADESDGSFLRLRPYCAVVTNIEDDHLDHYGNEENELEAFRTFVNGVKMGGFSVVCGDHFNVKALLRRPLVTRMVTYGMINPDVDVWGEVIEERAEGTLFGVRSRGTDLGQFVLNIPGLHNVSNALACIATALNIGVDLSFVREALSAFRGVKRRYERIGFIDGTVVIDDYAHHPTEMKVVIKTALSWTLGKVGVIFQPHRFTRTRRLFREMAGVLESVHRVILLPIYSAGEKPIDGVSSVLIYDALKSDGYDRVVLVNSLKEAAGQVEPMIGPGNILITMGAGDVWKVATALCRKNGNQPDEHSPVLQH
ncbi:MAG: UDP-N-acetylmuramate--L-alanine ligase [Candidatus Atribacteria bacterium]|nr:UDP-N-acetylmuramate--L-alanine ligase [Candidatus Atribacteria bacterium]